MTEQERNPVYSATEHAIYDSLDSERPSPPNVLIGGPVLVFGFHFWRNDERETPNYPVKF
jgi:hypothetical protein